MMHDGLQELLLDVSQEMEIEATVEEVYQTLIRRLSTDNATPDNSPMPMVLEEWPGGRWFRDLGEGQGHLWGLVQVIKPPHLLEIHGPLFMSYAATGHVQFRVTESAHGSKLTLRHRALGMIADDHRAGLQSGWSYLLSAVQRECVASV